MYTNLSDNVKQLIAAKEAKVANPRKYDFPQKWYRLYYQQDEGAREGKNETLFMAQHALSECDIDKLGSLRIAQD